MRSCYIKLGEACSLQHITTLKKRLNFILDNVNVGERSRILDIGTGKGVYIYLISRRYPHVNFVGIDINEKNIAQAKDIIQEENVELVVMNAERLMFKDDTFDVALMIEVLEHIPHPEKAIKEVYRVLKPGGKLIITAPNKLFPFETHGFRVGSKCYGTKGLGFPFLPYLPEMLRKHVANARVYTPWHLKRMLVKEGFSITNIKFLSPSLDQLRINFPRLGRFIEFFQELLELVEKIPVINVFLTTIIVCAMKVEK